MVHVSDKTMRALIALFVGSAAPIFIWLLIMLIHEVHMGYPAKAGDILTRFYIGTTLAMFPGFGLGWPAYLLMHKTGGITLTKCLFAGLLIGALPILFWCLMVVPIQYASQAQWLENLMMLGFTEVLSLSAAFVTWLVWRYLPGGDRAKSNG